MVGNIVLTRRLSHLPIYHILNVRWCSGWSRKCVNQNKWGHNWRLVGATHVLSSFCHYLNRAKKHSP